MALALYRKYRPRTFAEVIGQEHVTEPLIQALRTGRLNHAYLFSGPRGCGKTSSARILARSLNCAKGPTPEPCGECESCRALAPDGAGSIDVIEIDAASHGGVDDARELRERAFFAPVASRFKVYVIDEAHMVSSAGFNALLKLVEEPPEYVKFIFATTEPEKVLGTIKSRTHHYPFRLIPPGILRPYLEQLCGSEGVTVEPAIFPLVVRAGGGSVRDSLSVLDQLIAGAGPSGVSYTRAVALLGVTDVALIDEMCDALAAGDGAAAFATVDRVAEAGHDPRRFAADLLERLRDLIVLQQVPDAVGKGLIDAPADQLDRMAAQASRLGPATASRMADIVHLGLTEMRGTTAPRLLLELIVARMLLPGAEESTGSLLQRLERMERRLGAAADGHAQAPAPIPAAPPTPARIPAAQPAAAPIPAAQPAAVPPSHPAPAPEPTVQVPVAAAPEPERVSEAPADEMVEATAPGQVDAAGLRRTWDEITTMVRRKSPKVAALVREASVRDVQGTTIVLLFRHSFHAQSLEAAPELLLEAVYELLGGEWQIRCEVGGADGGSRPAPAPAPPPVPAKAPPAKATKAAPRTAPARKAAKPVEPSGDDAEDWPEPARPGGSTPVEQAPAAPTAPPQRQPSGHTPSGSPATSSGAGRANGAWADGPPPDEPPFDPDYDRPPGSKAPSKPVNPGKPMNPSKPVTASKPVNKPAGKPVGRPAEKPEASQYEGFDPGDEPMDDDSAGPATRETGEEQAIRLLTEHLGAERIGEVDHR